MLFVGYGLIGVAIVIATLVLLYQAYGFGLGKNGSVIQNDLTFFSSQPNPASIYVNGSLKNVSTNTRLVLPAGRYNVALARDGYRDWQHTIELSGGHVEHFDYPFLFPKQLTTKKLQSFAAAPGFSTQSPDRRWLLVQQPTGFSKFELYDLKNPAKEPTSLSLPDNLISAATGAQSWQLVEWAGDQDHVLLQHDYDGKTEYILVNRPDPNQSVNLNTSLSLSPAKLALKDKKFDQYYIYDAAGSLQTASLKNTTPVPRLQNVLAYKSYGSDTVLYVTAKDAPAGRVLVKLVSGKNTSTIRSLPAGTTYVTDLTKYSGTMYVAVGAASDNRVYIYKDPVGQLNDQPDHVPVPSQVLRVEQANYLSFSTSAQFIVAENGQRFGVYDIENETGYNYSINEPLDAPQVHASWMDGNRLTYTTKDKVIVFDFDGTNYQPLMSASPNYLPAFSPDYKFVYALAPSTSTAGQTDFNQTSLLAPADQ